MTEIEKFNQQVLANVAAQGKDSALAERTLAWILETSKYSYTYNFSWLGRPVIQFPQDMVAMQELIWSIKPDLIIETGIAHGGSLILYASMLALLDYCDSAQSEKIVDPCSPKRKVIGIDIDIREHNRIEINSHPLHRLITMIQGSSVDPQVIETVRSMAHSFKRVMVCLDSNHTHDHVLAELNAYAPLVSQGSYCVVFDTIVEDMPVGYFTERPWDKGNNPKTAVWEFLKEHEDFDIDKSIPNKLLATVAPDGFLRRSH